MLKRDYTRKWVPPTLNQGFGGVCEAVLLEDGGKIPRDGGSGEETAPVSLSMHRGARPSSTMKGAGLGLRGEGAPAEAVSRSYRTRLRLILAHDEPACVPEHVKAAQAPARYQDHRSGHTEGRTLEAPHLQR